MSTPQQEFALPREVAGFRLVREVGRGGMGVVYEAEEIALRRTVALKILSREFSVSGEAFTRFQREARLAAAISDSNCVFVFGAHQIDGQPAIAMELCGGKTLEAHLRRKEPIPIQTAVQWTLEILDGLEAAHRAGVVHRDVKPSNCFLTADGHVKIGDFGLSRTLEPDIGLTQSGQFLGSPLYASPEQIKGRVVDLRSDIYSAGATLYALLTGRAPFTGEGIGEVLARILSEPPPLPRSIRPEIPRGLEKVVLKAMSKDPEDRFADYASFREALSAFTERSLAPAHRGLRLLALIIDGFVRGVVVPPLLVFGGLEMLDPERPYRMTSFWIAAAFQAIPVLYHGLFEGLFGATPGKWLVRQRVVATASGHASFPRALLRAVIFFAVELLAYPFLEHLPRGRLLGPLAAAGLQSLFVISLMLTARRANGWRGVHELLSGTRTIQKAPLFRRYVPRDAVVQTPARPVEGLAAIGALAIEGEIAETIDGRLLRGRDLELARTVWLHESSAVAEPHEGRSADRATRLRWLGVSVQDGRRFVLYEDPGGGSLLELQRQKGRSRWSFARRAIESLAEELRLRAAEGTETRARIDQVWIDRSWNLRLVDVPVGSRQSAELAPVKLLEETARTLLTAPDAPRRLPPDLPAHADATVRRLLGISPGFASLDEARAAIADWSSHPAAVTRNARTTQIALSSVFAVITVVLMVAMTAIGVIIKREIGVGTQLAEELERAESAAEKPFDEEGLRARQILIAEAFRGGWGPLMRNQLSPRQGELVNEALVLHPTRSEADVAWAGERLDGQVGAWLQGDVLKGVTRVMTGLFLVIAIVWGLFATVSAFATRGGLSLRMTGICLRSTKGELASRLRCAARAAVAWIPATAILALGVWAMSADQFVLALALALGTAALTLGATIYALLGRGPSLQDRLAGTRLVPR